MVAAFSLFAALFHLGAALHQFANAWRDPESAVRGWSALLGCLAVGLHTLALYHGAPLAGGVSLAPFPALSLLLCATVGVTLFYSVFRPQAERLLILFQPLAAAAVMLALQFPDAGQAAIQGAGLTLHALIAVAAFSLLAIAGAQALYILFLHARLKKHRVLGLARMLPSLETQDRSLSQMLVLGAALLGAALLSGLPLLGDPRGAPLAFKNAFPTGAFAVLCVLLLGRGLFNWRAAATARRTLGALGLLIAAFLSGEFLLS